MPKRSGQYTDDLITPKLVEVWSWSRAAQAVVGVGTVQKVNFEMFQCRFIRWFNAPWLCDAMWGVLIAFSKKTRPRTPGSAMPWRALTFEYIWYRFQFKMVMGHRHKVYIVLEVASNGDLYQWDTWETTASTQQIPLSRIKKLEQLQHLWPSSHSLTQLQRLKKLA